MTPFWRRIAKLALAVFGEERLREFLRSLADAIVDAAKAEADPPAPRRVLKAPPPPPSVALPGDEVAQARARKVEQILARKGIV